MKRKEISDIPADGGKDKQGQSHDEFREDPEASFREDIAITGKRSRKSEGKRTGFNLIGDKIVCKTDLTPEFTDENGVGRCRVGIWFKPLSDEISHKLSKKYQLYKG